jgi:hypothetical protein
MRASIQVQPGSAEQPIVWLGMSGFSPQQRSVLESFMDRPSGLPRWQTGRFGDADAWLVNGSNTRVLPGGNLKLLPGMPTEQSLRLNLNEVDRPVGFATPLASAELEPLCTFNCASRASVHRVLLQFEMWLRPLTARFVVGSQIIKLGAQLRDGIYHVSHHGNLLAVLDFREGKAAIAPKVHPSDLRDAQWQKRPFGGGYLPEAFIATSPAQLTWTYVHRGGQDLLPPRYHREVIYFRGAPRVPMRWVRDSQLMVLRELSAEPGTLSSLHQRTGFAAAELERDLTCLYYAGSVTTTPAKAIRRFASHVESLRLKSESLVHSEHRTHHLHDFTAPAQLQHRVGGKPGLGD